VVSQSPLVSVVMSVRNGRRFLRSSLESILTGTSVELEFVIVDDGSTDETPEILADYARRDARILVVRQENAGLTRALANGCARARGTFIARQDDDDVSIPGRLEKLTAALETHPDAAVAASWVETIGPAGEPLHVNRYPEGVVAGTEAVLRARRSPVHGSVMFRKADFDAVGGYRPEFYFAQDADLWFRLADRGGFVFVPEVLYQFRIVDGSISASHSESQKRLYDLALACREARASGKSEVPLLSEASQIRPGRGGSNQRKAGAGSYFIGRTLLRNKDDRAVGYLRDYLRKRPLDPRGWLSLIQAHALRMSQK
jgi:glycosyltransferase involved in cell wall biosynthesis